MIGPIVIIGGGQSGAWIARTLRTEGHAGRITLLAEEPHHPYERPPLSKAVLQGAASPATLTLLDEAQAAALDIDLRLGTRVSRIDREARTVQTTDGADIPFGTLFIATGALPRRLSYADHPRIHTLRTQSDAHRLRAALAGAKHLLIVGGGWIGLEVAATARTQGVAVSVIEAAPQLCARTVPLVVSAWLAQLHAGQGVTLHLGCPVIALDPGAEGVTIQTAQGAIAGDHALVGIGIVPDTALAEAAGLDVEDGIVVDAQGRTSDPAIFAAGDVTRHPNSFAGGSLRQESWANAQNQAITAARAALGHAGIHDEAPWLWSDQYDANIQILGLPVHAARTIARGTPAVGKGCWLMLRSDGTMAGAVAVNAPRELRALRKMAADGQSPSPDAWADPATPLTRLTPATATAEGFPA